jgi:hypothetical protein
MTFWLVTQAWTHLLYADLVGLAGFRALRRIVPPARPNDSAIAHEATVEAIVNAVSIARMLYVKRVWCLQHSTVVTRLLRKRGIAADMIIGCHLAPIQAHAWVEFNGNVITEKVQKMEHFCVLDRW